MAASLKPEIDLDVLRTAFAKYDLGTLNEYQQLQGDVDISYKISSEKGVFLLKYIENKKNILQFEMLGDLHSFLSETRIPVPKIHKTKNGNYVEDDFILYDFIEGEIKKDWSNEEIVSLTSNFANMLIALKNYEVPEFVKNKNDKYTKGSDIKYCHDFLIPKILELSISPDLKESMIKTIDLLFTKLPIFEQLTKFLVDGDLNESNAIFKDGKNVGIIDLGISYEPIVYDLGEFCYWFTLPWWTEEFNKDRFNLIYETFHGILPLSADEKTLLPYMILRRGMMDLYLTLDWYWSNPGAALPTNRLSQLVKRNNKIISEFNLSTNNPD